MLKTKDDIKAEKAKDSGQIDLVDTIEEQKKQVKDKKFATYSLFFTLILSSLLWLYTEAKKIDISKFRLDLPQLKQTQVLVKPLTTIDELISTDLKNSQDWSLYFSITDQSGKDIFDYQKNLAQPFQKKTITESNSNFFSQSLPDGLNISEQLEEQNNSLKLDALIQLPNHKQFYIYIANSNTQNSLQIEKELEKLIPDIYWYLIQVK